MLPIIIRISLFCSGNNTINYKFPICINFKSFIRNLFTEEGSVFGQWLENILQESTIGRHEAKKDKADEVRSEIAYTQSLDVVSMDFVYFFVLL